MRKLRLASFLSMTLALLAAACGGGGSGDDRTDFQDFVTNLATTPVDNADPVAIDTIEFNFTEDPNAFDALFQ